MWPDTVPKILLSLMNNFCHGPKKPQRGLLSIIDGTA